MKILHVCLGERFVDGYGYQENFLTKLHKQMGHDVFVLASTFSLVDKKPGFVEPSEYVNEYGIPIKRLPYVSWLPKKIAVKLRLYKGAYDSIEKTSPDIFFIHEATFLDVKQIVKYKRRHDDVRVFVDSHTDYINSARNWLSMNILHKIIYRWCYQQIVPYTTKFFGTLPIRNQFLKEIYLVPEEKIELLPMGIDLTDIKDVDRSVVRNEMRKQYGYSKDDFVVITGGKLEKRKNTVQLIKAVLSINNPKVKLFLFGSVSDNIRQETEQFLSENANRVVYGGWAKSEEIYKYLLVGDLCVFPGTHSSIWEQAVGMGMPCLFKRWQNITHMDLGGNCILLDDSSPDYLAKEIETLSNNKQKFEQMRKVAAERGPRVFSYEEIAKRSIGLN